MLLLLLAVFLFFLAFSFPASLPACFPAVLFSPLLACVLQASELSGMHAYTVAACEVPILRPQLEHATSKKTAAWISTHLSVG